MSACHSPGAGRRPQPSAHMAPNVTELQRFPKAGCKLDAASLLLVASLLGPVHCTHRAKLGPDPISSHKLSSTGLKGHAKCQPLRLSRRYDPALPAWEPAAQWERWSSWSCLGQV